MCGVFGCMVALRCLLSGLQLLTLQCGLHRGAGEQNRAVVCGGEGRPDVQALTCQNSIAASRALGLLHEHLELLVSLGYSFEKPN